MLNNICFIVPGLGIGGAEKYVLELGSVYSRLNAKIHIISLGPINWQFVELFRLDSTKVIITPIRTAKIFSFQSVKAVVKICRYLKDNGISLVHLNVRMAEIIGGISAIIMKKRFIITQHDTQPWRYSKKIKDLVYKYLHKYVTCYAKAIIAPTYSVKEYLIETERIPKQKIKLIYHGINLESFPPKSKELEGKLIIGSLASLRPEKGHVHIIRAMPQVLEKLRSKKVELRIAGDGPAKEMLIEETERLGLSNSVKFLGPIYDVQKFLADICILVLAPISSEAFCYAVLEGMAMGKAVVATEIDGLPEIIRHRKNGLLIPPCSSEAIAEAIVSLALDIDLYYSICAKAQKDCRPFFSINRMANETYQLYKEINK